MRSLSIGLLHFPVLDAQGAVVTTAITNLDIHDLARSARSYGCASYWIVHPIEAQRALVERIQDHWTHGSSARRIPTRKDALALLRVGPSLEDMIASHGGREQVELWVTAARSVGEPIPFAEARARLEGEGKPVVILFGTGWGIAGEVVRGADLLLPPIRASVDAGYNHLSVRSACAITLDRLRG